MTNTTKTKTTKTAKRTRKTAKNVQTTQRVWTYEESIAEVNLRLADMSNAVNISIDRMLDRGRDVIKPQQFDSMLNELGAGIFVAIDDRSKFGRYKTAKLYSILQMDGFICPTADELAEYRESIID